MMMPLIAFGSTLRGFFVSETVTPTNSIIVYEKKTIWKLISSCVQPFGASEKPSKICESEACPAGYTWSEPGSFVAPYL